uniref:Uncharacterized protein n=1 Tax=Anguilla anguilla TaxID=7936 RepID=A0A0E9Q436_ANGAN
MGTPGRTHDRNDIQFIVFFFKTMKRVRGARLSRNWSDISDLARDTHAKIPGANGEGGTHQGNSFVVFLFIMKNVCLCAYSCLSSSSLARPVQK